ncbi:DUF898 family protein [Pararhizobium sp. IMCC21322]|uniref:DUF898 family protein n=1 Tax=Pararhizobium sp. IMCC21322 TaxID=3067903 RepID=UPI00274205D9|nr:DUF898 family protein [Pararhizobium sp. IMCC21322]
MNRTVNRSISPDPFSLPKPELAQETGHVVVEASTRELAGLALQGMLLTALTLGLYRFWYVTRVRKYFWAHTRIGNYPLEFTGHPVDLIVGFFMAVAILLPLYLGLFVVSLGLQNGVLAANLGAVLVVWFLSQFGLYRARNYRLTRMLWRGLRFRQGGSGIIYALLSTIWLVIGLASLGLLWPARRLALQAYKMRNTCFGNQTASFDASLTPLYRAGWPLFLGVALISTWTVWQFANIWQATPGTFDILDVLGSDLRNMSFEDTVRAIPFADILWVLSIAGFAFVAVLALAGPSYLAAETRHFAGATSFGVVRMNSKLTRSSLVAVWGRFLAILAVFSAVYLGLGAVLFGAFLYSDLPVGILDSATTRFWFFAALFLYYCIGFITYAVIHLVHLRFQLWRAIGNSMSFSPTDPISSIAVGSAEELRRRDGFGEGIADALDAGGV